MAWLTWKILMVCLDCRENAVAPKKHCNSWLIVCFVRGMNNKKLKKVDESKLTQTRSIPWVCTNICDPPTQAGIDPILYPKLHVTPPHLIKFIFLESLIHSPPFISYICWSLPIGFDGSYFSPSSLPTPPPLFIISNSPQLLNNNIREHIQTHTILF